MSKKGSQWEREGSVILSNWWTNNEFDDCFWRSQTSGARARVRAQKGKTTTGQHSDIAATRPEGIALTRLMTLELKRGYSDTHPGDLIDLNPRAVRRRKGGKKQKLGQTIFEQWYEQTISAHVSAKSFSWMIVSKRDAKFAISIFPRRLLIAMQVYGMFLLRKNRPIPYMTLNTFLRFENKDRVYDELIIMQFNHWMEQAIPKGLRRMSKDYKLGILK